jgi:hypothetical protein
MNLENDDSDDNTDEPGATLVPHYDKTLISELFNTDPVVYQEWNEVFLRNPRANFDAELVVQESLNTADEEGQEGAEVDVDGLTADILLSSATSLQ